MAKLPPKQRGTLIDAQAILSWHGTEDADEWSPELAELFRLLSAHLAHALDKAEREEAEEKRVGSAKKMIQEEFE